MRRRNFIVCAGTALTLGIASDTTMPKFDFSLLKSDAVPGELAALAGSHVYANGFALRHTGADPGFFALADKPDFACPHCRPSFEGDGVLFVFPRDGRIAAASGWTGILEIGGRIDPRSGTFSRVRLVDAVPVFA